MAKYTEQEIGTLIGWFPKLGDDPNFKITSDCTPAYNCIGWALGMNDVWVGLDHPTNYAWNWWPEGVPCNEKKESLIALFEYFGFTRCDNANMENNYDKVALYADEQGWTHAAKVIGEGVLHSKIGTAWDINHGDDDIFSDTSYGSIFVFMKRPISERYITDMKKPRIGSISISDF